MKKKIALMILCALCLLGGCAKKEENEQQAVPTVQVAYAAYRYEEGYQLAEGWMYDMTVSSEAQMNQLNGLLDQASFDIRDEVFEQGHGYRLTFRDAEGNATREILILKDGRASMEGMLYDAEGAEALLSWLDGLRIEEQDVTE